MSSTITAEELRLTRAGLTIIINDLIDSEIIPKTGSRAALIAAILPANSKAIHYLVEGNISTSKSRQTANYPKKEVMITTA